MLADMHRGAHCHKDGVAPVDPDAQDGLPADRGRRRLLPGRRSRQRVVRVVSLHVRVNTTVILDIP